MAEHSEVGEIVSTDTLDRLRSESLMLSEVERAELAHALVKSLDAPADANAADDWDAEVVRRLASIESNTAVLIDRNEFRCRVRARIGNQ